MKDTAIIAIVLGLYLAAGAAIAGNERSADPRIAEILQAQKTLRVKLDDPKGDYARLDKAAKQNIADAQQQIHRLLDGVNSMDALTDDQRAMLFNHQEEIRALVAANVGQRKVCHRERKTGSNLIQMRCETVADRERNAEESRKFLRDQQGQYQQGN